MIPENQNDTPPGSPDTDYMIRMTSVSEPLRSPVLSAAIKWLGLPEGGHGLDAGCGIGLQALLLAKASGAQGHVTGVDLAGELLVHAKGNLKTHELSRRICFCQGDLMGLPFMNDSFDWAWSSDCAGYGAEDPAALIREISRAVRPGGTVVILMWSSQKLLPGHPLLEARLDATSAGIAPFVKGTAPGRHFFRATGWFRKAGLQDIAARTFVADVQAPLNEDMREALTALFEMRWGGAKEEVAPGDWEEFERLCLPESHDFILNSEDYYAFFTYSLFRGTVPV
jgi:demethylmenaquinone methyltransferase / 2-methoxy-6-polyprenyl-1,4-benzoquinol methylase